MHHLHKHTNFGMFHASVHASIISRNFKMNNFKANKRFLCWNISYLKIIFTTGPASLRAHTSPQCSENVFLLLSFFKLKRIILWHVELPNVALHVLCRHVIVTPSWNTYVIEKILEKAVFPEQWAMSHYCTIAIKQLCFETEVRICGSFLMQNWVL